MIIERFTAQTSQTIWEFLREVSQDRGIFSYYSFIYPGMEDYTVFFYAAESEIVLVCLDIEEPGTKELADAGLTVEPFKYFWKLNADATQDPERKERRESPAMDLYYAALKMREYLCSATGNDNVIPTIHCMLLTNSQIENYDEVIDSWRQPDFGYTVLHGLTGLRPGIIYDSRVEGHPFIPVNEDFSIPASRYWTEWQEYVKAKGWTDWLND